MFAQRKYPDDMSKKRGRHRKGCQAVNVKYVTETAFEPYPY